MAKQPIGKAKRQQYTVDFKLEAVRLVWLEIGH